MSEEQSGCSRLLTGPENETRNHHQAALCSDTAKAASLDMPSMSRGEALVSFPDSTLGDLQRAFDSMSDAICILDRSHTIVRANRAMGALVSLKPELLTGLKCYSVMHGLESPLKNCPTAQCLAQGCSCEFECREPYLGNRWLGMRVDPLRGPEGDVLGVVHSVRDITERKATEDLKEQFLSMVSHEMKTPLTVVLGALHTVLTEHERITGDDRMSLIHDAYLEAETLSDIVSNMLELTRAKAGRLSLHTARLRLGNVLREMASRASRQHSRHRFVVDCAGDMPAVVADRTRLERIVYNLLDNAAKYSPRGSRITIKACADRDKAMVSVADVGEGISAEDCAKLFLPFERLGKENTGRGGTGLGLVVCRQLVEAHGGTIWVESEKGRGSTFHFTVPLQASTAQDISAEGRREP